MQAGASVQSIMFPLSAFAVDEEVHGGPGLPFKFFQNSLCPRKLNDFFRIKKAFLEYKKLFFAITSECKPKQNVSSPRAQVFHSAPACLWGRTEDSMIGDVQGKVSSIGSQW